MDVVLRPVNDRFLEEVAFPVFEVGGANAGAGLQQLHSVVADERTRFLAEALLARDVNGAFRSLDETMWTEATYRLLFWEWRSGLGGWSVASEYTGFAGALRPTLHLALMFEDPRYPYSDFAACQMYLDDALSAPDPRSGLAGMIAGAWDPCPSFAPHEVLATRARGNFVPGRSAFADWSYRSAGSLGFWSQQLPTKLGRLLRREQTRLRPLVVPEAEEILAYWMGARSAPPPMTVAFSGLGQEAAGWVRDLGKLVAMIRMTSQSGLGLTSIITPHVEPAELGL